MTNLPLYCYSYTLHSMSSMLANQSHLIGYVGEELRPGTAPECPAVDDGMALMELLQWSNPTLP